MIAAAAGSWIFGAVWYMSLSKAWIEVSGVKLGADGKPANDKSPVPHMLSALCMVLVAGMMRHMLNAAGITEVGQSALTGLGVGLFFIAPWIMINNGYAGRPFKATLIDGGYAVFGCTIIGLILALF